MQLTFFCRAGWQDWDVAAEPAIPDRMPLLVDDDLIFEDAGVPRPSVAVNRWLRELPVSGAPSPGTWAKYGRALRDWMAFLLGLGIAIFDTRDPVEARAGRLCGAPGRRPGRGQVGRLDVEPEHLCVVGVLPVGGCRGARERGAVHLRPGAVPLL